MEVLSSVLLHQSHTRLRCQSQGGAQHHAQIRSHHLHQVYINQQPYLFCQSFPMPQPTFYPFER